MSYITAFQFTLAPVLVEKINKRMAHITLTIKNARKTGKDPIIDVVLFENQRFDKMIENDCSD